jgi:hypothetical protein
VEKGKALPATGLGGKWGFEVSKFQHFLYNRLRDGGEDVLASLLLPPRKTGTGTGTHFC